MTVAGLLSPSSVGTEAWIALGLYVLGLAAWERRKVVRHARRERALTEQVRRREQEFTEEARRHR